MVNHIERKLGIFVWLLYMMLLFASCTPANEAGNEAVTRENPEATIETVVTSVVTPTSITTPTAKPNPTEPPTIEPSPSAMPTEVSARFITDAPIFSGGDLQFQGWSPNSRYLTYIEYTEEQVATEPVEGLRGTYPGTFVIYDTQTGEKCTDYLLSGYFSYEGGSSGAPWRWLPDGSLLIQAPDRQPERTNVPCTPGMPISIPFISSIESFSPDKQKILLTNNEQYLIYDWMADSAIAIPEVKPTHFNNLIWSPDSQHISITLEGNSTGESAPIGGTRVVDVTTGEITARYDWEPATALDGTFGGPVWIDNETFIVTLSLDQGPFFMTVDGEVTPLLPLFDVTFDPENYWPPVEVHAEGENNAFAILYRNDNSGDSKLLIVQDGMETIERLSSGFYYQIYPGGLIGYQGNNGHFWIRPIFEIEAPFTEQAVSYNPWVQNETSISILTTSNNASITLFDHELDETVDVLMFEDYESEYNFYPVLSPDGAWLAVFITEPQWGYGRALFVVPVMP